MRLNDARLWFACTAAGLTILQSEAALVPNGDFEDPVESPMQMLTVGATIPGWTVVGSGNATVHHVSANFNVWPGDNTQFMDLTGNTGNAGVVSDPLSTVQGQTYRIGFDAYNGSLVFPGTAFTGEAFSLQASGSAAIHFSPVAGVASQFTYTFVATGTATSLTFMDLSGFDSNAGWIDNVTLTAVPEPTTMIAAALLLLPFGVSTLRILRKKRAV